MKANKVTLSVEAEALSPDVFRSLLCQAGERIQAGYISGTLTADDGDTVTWDVVTKAVEF